MAADDQIGDESGPARLMRCAQAFARIAVEVLVEEQLIVPAWIVLKPGGIAEGGTVALVVVEEQREQATAELPRHLIEGEELPRARRTFDAEVITEVAGVASQCFDDDVVDRKPHRPAPVGVTAEQPARRLGRLIVDNRARRREVELERLVAMAGRHRTNAVWRQHAFFVEHVRQYSSQALR